MEKNLALVLVLAPFFGFLANIFFGKKAGKGFVGLLGTLSILISFFATTYFFTLIQSTGKPVTVNLFEWISLEKFNISFSFLLDQLSVLWLLFVTGIGTLIHMYSASYMHDDENMHKFFAYLNLFVFFMITLVMGSNLLILFIGWEGVGLCSYLLIGFWYKNQDYNDAAKKAFIMNRVGDLGLLIGIFILAYVFGSLEYSEISKAIFSLKDSNHDWMISNSALIGIAALCLFIGATGKSAQVPLYTWLPDAMAGPTPVSALIHAATMVTAGIFMVTRLNFVFDLAPNVQVLISVIGAITAVLAAAIGLVQNDIKKVLAYSTVSQLGLMFLALGLGAYEVAVFHVITHAFFKACLFLGSGSVIHALHGEQDMRNMGGLKKVMPITYWTMMISTLAISGIFPFAGFWSKDEILMSAYHGNVVLWVVGSIASIMTAFYMFRLMYLTFFGEFRGTEEQKHHLHESPKLITIPLMILAALALVGGAINLPGSTWLNHYLAPLFHKAHGEHHLDNTAFMLMGIATVGALIGIYIAYSKYISKKEVPVQDSEIKGIASVLYNKFYVDEAYEALIVNPIYKLSHFFRKYTEVAISEFLFGLGKITNLLGNQGKLIQNGNIGMYLLAFVIGLSSILAYIFLV